MTGRPPVDCDPDWADDYEPSDRTPTLVDLRRAELRDCRGQRVRITRLRTAQTINAGSRL